MDMTELPTEHSNRVRDRRIERVVELIPPVQILELRNRVRLRKTLIDQRTAWLQRLQAQLFHQGVPPGLKPRTAAGRDALARVELSPAGREARSAWPHPGTWPPSASSDSPTTCARGTSRVPTSPAPAMSRWR